HSRLFTSVRVGGRDPDAGEQSRVSGLGSTARLFTSVRVAPSDSRTLYVASSTSTMPFMLSVQRSDDGGATFSSFSFNYLLDGTAPFTVEVVAVDPRNPKAVYLRASASGGASAARQAL